MPGLLDLPPELIERIFKLTEDYVVAAQVQAEQLSWYDQPPELQQTATKFKAPVTRYISRYIESATRRLFADTFNSWHIRAADDQSITKFCTIIKTSDVLAEGIRELNIYVDDDRMIPMRQGKLKSTLDLHRTEISHTFSMTATLSQWCLWLTFGTATTSSRHWVLARNSASCTCTGIWNVNSPNT
jgi:hypothetical protein